MYGSIYGLALAGPRLSCSSPANFGVASSVLSVLPLGPPVSIRCGTSGIRNFSYPLEDQTGLTPGNFRGNILLLWQSEGFHGVKPILD